MEKTRKLIISALVLMMLAGCGGNRTNNKDNTNIPSDTSGNTANDKNMGENNLGDDMKDGAQSVGEGVSDGVKDLGEGVKDVGNGVAEGIDDMTGNNKKTR